MGLFYQSTILLLPFFFLPRSFLLSPHFPLTIFSHGSFRLQPPGHFGSYSIFNYVTTLYHHQPTCRSYDSLLTKMSSCDPYLHHLSQPGCQSNSVTSASHPEFSKVPISLSVESDPCWVTSHHPHLDPSLASTLCGAMEWPRLSFHLSPPDSVATAGSLPFLSGSMPTVGTVLVQKEHGSMSTVFGCMRCVFMARTDN